MNSVLLLVWCFAVARASDVLEQEVSDGEEGHGQIKPASDALQQELCPLVRTEIFLEQLDKNVELLQQNSVRLDAKREHIQADINKVDLKMDILRDKITQVISTLSSANNPEHLNALQVNVGVIERSVDRIRFELRDIKELLEASNINNTTLQEAAPPSKVTSPESPKVNKKKEFCEPDFLPRDCWDWLQNGNTTSGIYDIYIRPFCSHCKIQIFCDMDTDGGGWTVFQRRGNYPAPRTDFFRSWLDYKWGFGDLEKEFWLGLEYLFMITNNVHSSLRVDLQDFEENKRYAFYKDFSIRGEDQKYRLKINDYFGDAGDSMTYSNDQSFSTKDEDNDQDGGSCAVTYSGAWWYKKCHQANLNGKYLIGTHTSFADGVNWMDWLGYKYSLKWTEMKTRPKMK